MSTREILSMIGMMDGVNERLAEFSMNYGLQEDDRFDEVGPAGQVLWYLVRMEPEDVRKAPERLAFEPQVASEFELPAELEELEHLIRDEHTPIPVKRGRLPESVKLTLTYPHRRAGTLPLSHELRRMFPTAYQAPRVRFTMIDGETEQEIPAWVVRSGGYVYGLTGWFENHDVPTGGYLTIERTETPGQVRVNSASRNARKEWVLTARVENERLKFDNQQWPIACDYDELLIIAVEDEEAVDNLWRKVTKNKVPLETVIADIGRELSHLNPQGNIHAKTFYSAVNLIKRCPPGPIFATLIESPLFEHVGGPYFKMAGDRA